MLKQIALTLLLTAAGPVWAADALDKAQIGGTLDCGYIPYNPVAIKDVKTGAWRGLDIDLMDLVAERLELSYTFKTETNFGVVVEDFRAKKYDLLCSTYWVNPHKAKFVLYTRPLYYVPLFIVARRSDKRFDGHFERIDDAKIKIAVLEGDNPVNIAHSDFPKAQLVTLPSSQSYPETLLMVADGKADVVIADANAFGLYNKANPGKLRIVNPERPVRIYPTGFVLKSGDVQLWHAFNAAIEELALDGTLQRTVEKYTAFPHAFYPVSSKGDYVVDKKPHDHHSPD